MNNDNPVSGCEFCDKNRLASQIVLENKTCLFINSIDFVPEGVLTGSGMIIPKSHKETPFDLSDEELKDTFSLLKEVKKYLDKKHSPDGYTIGWNIGAIGGQNVFHAHLHILPRYKDEPLAGKGIRYAFKQATNKRTGDK